MNEDNLDKIKETPYEIEMLNITKEFNGFKANDDITLQLKKVKSTHFWVRTGRGSPLS